MGYLIYTGLKGRKDRRTAIAAGVVGGESLIFLGNRCRCPLTGLAEKLGATSGSVTDISLPGFLASHLVLIHVPLLTLALCLHIRNFRRQVKSMRSEFLPCQLSSRFASREMSHKSHVADTARIASWDAPAVNENQTYKPSGWVYFDLRIEQRSALASPYVETD